MTQEPKINTEYIELLPPTTLWGGDYKIKTRGSLAINISNNSNQVSSIVYDWRTGDLYFENNSLLGDKFPIGYDYNFSANKYDTRWGEVFEKYGEKLNKVLNFPHDNIAFRFLSTFITEGEIDPVIKGATDYLLYCAEQGEKFNRHPVFGEKDEYFDKQSKRNARVGQLREVGLSDEIIQDIIVKEGLVEEKKKKKKTREKDGTYIYTKGKPREFNAQKCEAIEDSERAVLEQIKKGSIITFGGSGAKSSEGMFICEKDAKVGVKALRGVCLDWTGKVDYQGKWVRVYLEQIREVDIAKNIKGLSNERIEVFNNILEKEGFVERFGGAEEEVKFDMEKTITDLPREDLKSKRVWVSKRLCEVKTELSGPIILNADRLLKDKEVLEKVLVELEKRIEKETEDEVEKIEEEEKLSNSPETKLAQAYAEKYNKCEKKKRGRPKKVK